MEFIRRTLYNLCQGVDQIFELCCIHIGQNAGTGSSQTVRAYCMVCLSGVVRHCRRLTTPAPFYFLRYSNSHPGPLMATQPLDFAAGPLVWIDCEMTGLDP